MAEHQQERIAIVHTKDPAVAKMTASQALKWLSEKGFDSCFVIAMKKGQERRPEMSAVNFTDEFRNSWQLCLLKFMELLDEHDGIATDPESVR